MASVANPYVTTRAGGPLGHPSNPLVIGIEDGRATRREGLDQLALLGLDRLDRADPGEMDRLDAGDDADPWPADPGEIGDVACDVHAHLEDERLICGGEAQDGQRQADLVVLVALVLERPIASRQDGRHGLLRRGLGEAPGDPDGERIEPPAPGGGEGVERRQRPGDPDDADVADRGRQGARPADQESRRTGLGRGDEVIVAVGPFAGQGNEQVARPDSAQIDGRAADRASGRPFEPTARQPGDLGPVERLVRRARVRRRRSVDHGRQCPIAAIHRSALAAGSGRSSIVIASVARRRKSSYDSTASGRSPWAMWSGLASWMVTAMTSSGLFRPM